MKHENTYPCKECLIMTICKTYCNKVKLVDDRGATLTNYVLKKRECPHCGSTLIIRGEIISAFNKQPYPFPKEVVCGTCSSKFFIYKDLVVGLHCINMLAK